MMECNLQNNGAFDRPNNFIDNCVGKALTTHEIDKLSGADFYQSGSRQDIEVVLKC
jgi:hypothetical protein